MARKKEKTEILRRDPSKPLRAVIYARYSSDNQREESIEGQLRVCKEYIERKGMELMGEYIDRAKSAQNDDRPDFQRMIRDAQSYLFDVVVIYAYSRFYRNYEDSVVYERLLNKYNVVLLSATEALADDAFGKLQKAWIKINDEQYIRKLSIDTRRGMMENALKGEWNGGPTPFGYYIGDDHKLAIDPQQAIVVREIYQMYAQGINCKAIEQYLEEKKIRRDKGRPLLYNSIRNLLQNRIYIGEYHHCGIVIPDGIPAIVDEELFDSVQKMFKKNAKAPAAHTGDVDYLLTTKLFCGKCGAMMVAQAGTSQTGDVYRYYACVRQKKHICDKKTVGKEKIENYVVYKTMEFLKQEGVTDRLAKIMFELQKKESSLIPQLEDQLKEKEKIINNLADAIEEGRGSKTLIMRLEKAEDDREEIIRSIEKEKIRIPQLTLEEYKMVFERFKYLDITTETGKRQLINAFVGAVFAYDDHFKIVYNIDGKEETFSLSELKSSNLFSSGEPHNPDKFQCACGVI